MQQWTKLLPNIPVFSFLNYLKVVQEYDIWLLDRKIQEMGCVIAPVISVDNLRILGNHSTSWEESELTVPL